MLIKNLLSIFISFFYCVYALALQPEVMLPIEGDKAVASINQQYKEIQKYKDVQQEMVAKINQIKKIIDRDGIVNQEISELTIIIEKLLEKSYAEIILIDNKLKIKLKFLYDFFSLTFNNAVHLDHQEEYNEMKLKHDCGALYIMQAKLQKINRKLDECINKSAYSSKEESIILNDKIVDIFYVQNLYYDDLLLELGGIKDTTLKMLQNIYLLKQKVLKEKLLIEKKILENNIVILENKLKKFRKNIFLNNTVYEYKKNYYKKNQKNITEKKNIAEKELRKLSMKGYSEHNIEEYMMQYHQSKDTLNQKIIMNNIEYIISTMLNSIIIDICNIELYCNQKDTALVDALYLTSQKEVSVNQLHNTLKEINYRFYKNVYVENNDKIKKHILDIEYLLTTIKKNKIHLSHNYMQAIEKNYELLKTIKNDFFEIVCASNFLYKELQHKIFWSRSENSIGLNKVRNFSFEMKLFFQELRNKFSPTMYTIYYQIVNMNNIGIMQLIYLLLCIFFIITTSFIYKLFFEKLFYVIDSIEIQSYYIRKISLLIKIISEQKIIFFIWLNLFFFIYFKIIDYYYINTIFYLLSIFISGYFLYSVIEHNYDKHPYNDQYKPSWYFHLKRFIVDHWRIYTLVFLFFFRLALMSLIYGNAHKIILVVQFIIMQIELILFLKKKNIMQNIVNFNLFNEPLKKYITRYYQFIIFFLTIIILMSNPYVGYGNQVFYFFSRFFFSLLFIPLWNFIFDFVKNYSMYIFFIFDEGEARGTIRNAKLLYFLFLLFFYILTIGIAGYIILNVWGYDVNISFMINLIYKNLLPQNNNGDIAFSLYNLYTPLFYIFKGYVISYFVNQFVLSKILNPIVIGQTMQNTMMILVRYIIVTTFFILGLCVAGLESLIVKLGTLIVGFSFALKEPLADFICYFIILIQCPIKVGDLIRIHCEGGGADSEVTGIVRSIKGRTTIIRQRNGQTVIIPNSFIVKRAICNWTYYRSGFISIEDFLVTIDRAADIDYVKGLIIKVIEMNPAILKNPLPMVRCENINPLGYEFLIRGYISPDRANDQWEIASQLRIALIKKLQQENIKFAIPSFNVYSKAIENAYAENPEN